MSKKEEQLKAQVKKAQDRLLVLEQRKQKILDAEKKERQRISKTERNLRTKRLIEIGATVESALNVEVSAEDLPKLKQILEREEIKNIYSSL